MFFFQVWIVKLMCQFVMPQHCLEIDWSLTVQMVVNVLMVWVQNFFVNVLQVKIIIFSMNFIWKFDIEYHTIFRKFHICCPLKIETIFLFPRQVIDLNVSNVFILNICFDFFHSACLYKTTTTNRLSKFDTSKSMSLQGQYFNFHLSF